MALREVICKTNFGGYGTYRWYIDSPIHADPNIVLASSLGITRVRKSIIVKLISIDLHLGRCGFSRNAQYVVQLGM